MSWEDGLSPEQKIVASHIGSPARLLAGPGTGKTRTLTGRVAFLVQEVEIPTGEILALTFTRAAASELRERVGSNLGGEAPRVSTLHSFALQSILRFGAGNRLPSPVRIADDYEEAEIIEKDIKQILELENIGQARALIGKLSADWETLRADGADWENHFPNPRFLGAWQEHRKIYGYTLRSELVYQLKLVLEEEGADFGDCPSHLLIDEYQDLNACDLAIVKNLSNSGAELYVAGDDDQSIYGFRYADPTGIRRFLTEYPRATPLSLTECHRSGCNILAIAEHVASQDPRRLPKPLTPCQTRPGEVHLLRFPDYTEEALGIATIARWLNSNKGIPYDQILILLRSDRFQKFSDPIRVALEGQGLPAATIENPYQILDSKEGRIFLSFLRLMEHPNDSLAWRTLIARRDNNIGDHGISSIYNLARERGVAFSEAVRLIADCPTLVSRFGYLIQNEYQAITASVALLKERHDNSDRLDVFIEWVLNEFLSFDLADEIVGVINTVIDGENDISIDDLLKELSNPLNNIENVRTEGNINIMTMHQAKGLDAQAVIVAAAEDEYIPGWAEGVGIDDERRLLYVSLTRAKSFLYITYCSQRTGGQKHSGRNSGVAKRTLTRFLRDARVHPISANEYLDTIT